ncbi:hypothetical protein HDC37_001418 [Microbacterium sp. AK009]|uniref:hypothetical protein n=1 Tax=Microbacterium sp. AK009 TaxID=2723068 RepID=UPI0015C6E7D9|nr:hypothetical protein [Microbacterium sp. AK009]NYF16593.1 hypothetical protein [Microbacterium sp. AK009]
MTWEDATLPVGSALRIAPAFQASAIDEAAGIETSLHARYRAFEGRYLFSEVNNRALRADVEVNNLVVRRVPIRGIVQIT